MRIIVKCLCNKNLKKEDSNQRSRIIEIIKMFTNQEESFNDLVPIAICTKKSNVDKICGKLFHDLSTLKTSKNTKK